MQASTDDTIVVVGGGLAGLAAAAYLARAGRSVTVLERAGDRGRAGADDRHWRLPPEPGSARTVSTAARRHASSTSSGWLARAACPPRRAPMHSTAGPCTRCPAASYRCSPPVSSESPARWRPPACSPAWRGSTPALSSPPRFARGSRATCGRIGARRLIEALFRLSTYAHAPDTMSAGLAVGQLQLALAHNVRYLDGGWETLVDGLRSRVEEHGGRVRTAAAVVELVRGADGALAGVRLRSGEVVPAAAVILALDAAAAAPLLPEGAAHRAARDAVPVRAACLDVGLARLPRPRATFALGIDEPLYCSVHSAAARLAPEGGAMIHVARYLGDDTPDPGVVERQLEGVLDHLQPGWRDVVVERRFLPHMVAASALATATEGGIAIATWPGRGGGPEPVPRRRLDRRRGLARRRQPGERGRRGAPRAGAPTRPRGPRRRDRFRTTRRRHRVPGAPRSVVEPVLPDDRGRGGRGRSRAGDVRARPGPSAGGRRDGPPSVVDAGGGEPRTRPSPRTPAPRMAGAVAAVAHRDR